MSDGGRGRIARPVWKGPSLSVPFCHQVESRSPTIQTDSPSRHPHSSR